MRPIELALENFGAYRRRVIVDFEALGPLFLVWGKTGSGKTTLFDAMAYALYGEAPGSRSKLAGELRSQYAAPGESPRVEFRFALGGQEWRALRSPPHQRPGRGGRLVEVPQEAQLDLRRGEHWEEAASGPRAVDERVRSLLGLSADEFSKIILLPQGEFQRFLEMASSERVEILEKIFPVDLHDRVTVLALEGSRAAQTEGRRLDAELTRLAEAGAGPEGELELGRLAEAEVLLVAENAARLEARLGAERGLAEGRADAEKRKNLERAALRLASAEEEGSKAPALAASLDAARRAALVLPLLEEAGRLELEAIKGRRELETRQAEFDALRAKETEIAAELEGARFVALEIETLDRQRGELEGALAAWAGLDAARGSRDRVVFELEGCTREVRGAEAGEAQTVEALTQVSRSIEEEEGVEAHFSLAREDYEKKKLVERAAEAVAAAEPLLAQANHELGRSGEELRKAEIALASGLAAWEGGLASELAAGLTRGEPCPVCGSLEHPRPASASGGISTMELEALRSAREGRLGSLKTAEARVEGARERMAAAQRDLAALFEGGVLPITKEEARETRLEAEGAVASAAAELAKMREGRRRAGELQLAVEAARASKLLALAREAGAREQLAGLEERLRGLVEGAGASDPRPLVQELDQRRRRLEAARLAALERGGDWDRSLASAASLLDSAARRQPELETLVISGRARASEALRLSRFSGEAEAVEAKLEAKAFEALDARLRALEAELVGARAAYAECEEAVGPGEAADLPLLEAAAKEAKAGLAELGQGLEKLRRDRDRLAGLVRERHNISSQRTELDLRSGNLAALAELLAGNLPPRRLPFKNFVLGAYFKAVVDRASLRLFELSDGRYTLQVDEGPSSGRARIGLELLVADAYSGRSRPSGTLSGGERFLSSLALALGLADTIKSRSGGVSLDAIFIDEGFGSLDEETLDRALTALDRVRGDRVIGLVSHVAELRNRIPSRIEVIKERGGSRLEMIL